MTPKVTERHREERRLELLNSALHCFSEQGYEATTVDDIVHFAGVSKGMLYTYFPSKEDIFLALVQQRTHLFLIDLEGAFAKRSTAWSKLEYLLDRYRRQPLSEEGRKWMSVYLEFYMTTWRNEARLAFIERRFVTMIAALENVIQEGKKSGEFRQDLDATAVSSLYWALVDGIHLHVSQRRDLAEYDSVYGAAIDMLQAFVMERHP